MPRSRKRTDLKKQVEKAFEPPSRPHPGVAGLKLKITHPYGGLFKQFTEDEKEPDLSDYKGC